MTRSPEWAFVDIVNADGSLSEPGASARTDGASAATIGSKCRCVFCGLKFAPQARLIRTHVAGLGGPVRPCPGPGIKDGEAVEAFTARQATFSAAKTACQAALAKKRDSDAKAVQRAALDAATGGGSAARQKDVTTWLAKPHQAQQQTADEALTLAFACAGIAPNALTVPELATALKEVAKCGLSYSVPSRKRVGGSLLRKVYEETKLKMERANSIAEEGGVTVTSDGVTSRQRKPLINLMEVSGG